MGLVNRHLPVLQWVQGLVKGSINSRTRNRKSPHAKNWSQTYDLNFRSGEQKFVLEMVLPYLKIKVRQAELALELLATTQDRTKEYRLTPEVRQRRLEIYREAKELNWAGIDRSGLALV